MNTQPTRAKVVDRETAIGRIQAFHHLRIARVWAGNDALIAAKLRDFSYEHYSAMPTIKILREYDETFSTIEERNGRNFWPWELEEDGSPLCPKKEKK